MLQLAKCMSDISGTPNWNKKGQIGQDSCTGCFWLSALQHCYSFLRGGNWEESMLICGRHCTWCSRMQNTVYLHSPNPNTGEKSYFLSPHHLAVLMKLIHHCWHNVPVPAFKWDDVIRSSLARERGFACISTSDLSEVHCLFYCQMENIQGATMVCGIMRRKMCINSLC